MTSDTRVETSHALTVDEWCASGWQPPEGVTAGSFDGRGRWHLAVAGRRKPVVGVPTRDERGWFYAPANRNARRGEDAALLDRVAAVVGMTARIPRPGRPARRGVGEAAARIVEAETAAGVPRAEALQAASEAVRWDVGSIARYVRRRRKALE